MNDFDSYVYLAGDSSLDSKYWYRTSASAVNGYERVIRPPKCKCDLAFYLNAHFAQAKLSQCAINCAIEESTLANRANGALLPQDEFIRDHIQRNDTLIVSVGGNDIALRPSFRTIWNMLLMHATNSAESLQRGPSSCWGMSHFVRLFKDDLTAYIQSLMSKTKPKRVVVCMIYFPDEQRGGWADRVLGALSYYSNPRKLQTAIEQIYQHAIQQIDLGPDVDVVPFPLFKTLDGKDSSLYCAGVEPSTKGNERIAESMILHLCD